MTVQTLSMTLRRAMDRGVAVYACMALGLLLATGAQAAPGDPDLSFGTNGRVAALFSGVANSRPGGMLIQPDGKIVVAGGCGATTEVICIGRRLPNGTPDPDFGTQGTVVTTDQIANPGTAAHVVMQPGGKLVIASTCSPSLFCAIRLNSNGTRDSTFGTNGKVTVTNRISVASTRAFAQQRDGKLVFAGACNSVEHCAARIEANGLIDNSFGGDGVVFVVTPPGVQDGSIDSIAISEQVDGKLVLSGKCRLLAAPPLPEAIVPCAFRRQSNGASDLSYGTNGLASERISADGGFQARAAVVQADDAVVIGGGCGASNRKACVARFDAGGRFDSTLQTNAAPALFTLISALAVQHDGKLLAAGQCAAADGDQRICFLRYHSDGSLDASLPAIVDAARSAGARSIATQSDGKIVVVGDYYQGANQLVILNRYEGGPFGSSACSLDIDGDGVLNPAIDGVILTRATLGFSGSNVYAGITFAANATRTRWGTGGSDDIRKFLVSQCGMKLFP
jgi:uncharacterized delta-60 repeat protein